jgi:prepilin-type N-terminal cleavage/methylation domain-containing protein
VEPSRHNPRSTRHHRRGLTFIETVCAVALLGIVSATVYGAFNSILSSQQRQQHRLNAMELANRLILQYLDEASSMPTSGLPILYGKNRYRWDLKEIPVRLLPSRPEIAEERASAAPISVDRMQAIAVRVWLSEESGGSTVYDTNIPAVALTRLMDPIALRNPDVNWRLRTDAARQAEFIDRYSKIGRNATSRNPRSNPQPRTVTPPPTTVNGTKSGGGK